MNFLFFIFIYLIHFIFSRIIIPFEKNDIEIKSLKDMMNNIIKCKIEIGNPSQFLYLGLSLNYHGLLITSKSLNNISFDELNSNTIYMETSYKNQYIEDKLNIYGIISIDNFKLLTEDGTKINRNIYFNLVKNSTDNDTLSSGIIGLKIISMLIFKEENFIYQLKEQSSIKNYVFSLNFSNENEGSFIIGNYPDEYDKNYNEKNYYFTKALTDEMNVIWELYFNEIKYGSNIDNNKYFKFNLFINGIIGSNKYKEFLINNLFNLYLSNNTCKEEFFENFYYNFSGFYCDNNINLKDKFETIYLYHKEFNFTFNLSYDDLFKIYNNKLYFLVYFKEKNEEWVLGEIFLKKYLLLFDMERKTIGFYKNNNFVYEIKKNNNKYLLLKIFIGILILCSLLLLFLIRKYKLKNKMRKNQLNDDDYYYKPKNENYKIFI